MIKYKPAVLHCASSVMWTKAGCKGSGIEVSCYRTDVCRLKTCLMLQLLYPEEGMCDTSRGSSSCKSLYPEDPATLQDPAWRTSRHVETKTNFFVGCEGEKLLKKWLRHAQDPCVGHVLTFIINHQGFEQLDLSLILSKPYKAPLMCSRWCVCVCAWVLI